MIVMIRVRTSGAETRAPASTRWRRSGRMTGAPRSLSTRAARGRGRCADGQGAGQAVVDQPDVIQPVKLDEGLHPHAAVADRADDAHRKAGRKHAAVPRGHDPVADLRPDV